MKTIGLIGGMSWESSAHYYAILNRETARIKGGLHSAPILMHSLDFAPIADMQAANQWEEAGAVLAQSAQQLQNAGADLIAIATNTMHIAYDQVKDAIDVPLIHIADPTADELTEDGFETIGLLGTSFTMEMPFYRERLVTRGLNVLVPEVDITNLNGIIFEQLCKGIVLEESRRIYQQAIARLAARGAEAIILGCTELSMLISEADSPVPVYDTTELHAKALVAAALAD